MYDYSSATDMRRLAASMRTQQRFLAHDDFCATVLATGLVRPALRLRMLCWLQRVARPCAHASDPWRAALRLYSPDGIEQLKIVRALIDHVETGCSTDDADSAGGFSRDELQDLVSILLLFGWRPQASRPILLFSSDHPAQPHA